MNWQKLNKVNIDSFKKDGVFYLVSNSNSENECYNLTYYIPKSSMENEGLWDMEWDRIKDRALLEGFDCILKINRPERLSEETPKKGDAIV